MVEEVSLGVNETTYNHKRTSTGEFLSQKCICIMNVMNAMVDCHQNKNSDLRTWSGNSGISNLAYKRLLIIKITVKIIKEKNHLSKKTV